MNLFEELNDSQKQAVSHIDGAMLILAGAGSGKTKTITTRLAYLIGEVGIPSHNTLTLTFTNKAASVMRHRALNFLQGNHNPLLCTFHKFGLLFLKLHFERLERKNSFIVIDTDDTKKIIKDLIHDKNKDNVYDIIQYISYCKNEGKRVSNVFEDLNLLKEHNFEKYQNEYKFA
ncbi:ATP-dependent helicase, partial [Campylobacter jejuni]|nr:ATP-dependent helicase [Campylobacter jejuni]ELI9112116.1 ATP-dependent helicase [Campylobacter jejuni]ELN8403686.1 ATP-dependent helicase [Campylobacter jejuni]